MCIICASIKGIRQPSLTVLRNMFENNPDGAGYMTARGGLVEIRKGFMTWDDFASAIKAENFKACDPVVYHFRISTQAGVIPEMTHPFPITGRIEDCKLLRTTCELGAAHNGIIQLTTDRTDREYSDTAHYVAEFLRYFVRTPDDLRDPDALNAVRKTTRSKWALMDGTGYIATVGAFIAEPCGLLYSNGTYRKAPIFI